MILLLPLLKNVGYRCIIHNSNKSKAINLLKIYALNDRWLYIKMNIQGINIKNRVYSYHFDNLGKAKKLETKSILIDGKDYKYLKIFFASYVHRKSIKMLIFHYHELMRKTKEHEGTKYLMVNDYMLDKVLDKNLMILRF